MITFIRRHIHIQDISLDNYLFSNMQCLLIFKIFHVKKSFGLTKKSYHYNTKTHNRIHMKIIMIAKDDDKCFWILRNMGVIGVRD